MGEMAPCLRSTFAASILDARTCTFAHQVSPQWRTSMLEWPRLLNQSQDRSEIGSNCHVLATANHMSCSMLDFRIHLLFHSNQREPTRNRYKIADSADGIGKDYKLNNTCHANIIVPIDRLWMSWLWQRLCSGKLWFLRDSCRQQAVSSELAWSRADSPQPENAYGESERLGLSPGMPTRDARHVAIAAQGYGYYNLRPTNR